MFQLNKSLIEFNWNVWGSVKTLKKVMRKKKEDESSHKGEKRSHKGKGKAAESSNKRGSRK